MNRDKVLDLAKWAILGVLLVLAAFHFRGMIAYTLHMFAKPVEDMTHGYLIPLVSGYVIWHQRDQWKKLCGDCSWLGICAVVFFCILAFFGSRGDQSRVEQIAAIGLIWSVPFALWGRGAAKFLAFPAAYLVFTIPISSFIDFCTVHLRIFSTTLSAAVVNGLGLAVAQSGSSLCSMTPGAEFNVDVAAGCSGIRSLFALIAFTAIWMHFFQKGWWRKAVVLASTVPVAIFGNVVRLSSTCFAAVWFGEEFGLGAFHDYAGFPVFIMEVFLVQMFNSAISKRFPPPAKAADEEGGERFRSKKGGDIRLQYAMLLTVFAICAWTLTLTWRTRPVEFNEDSAFVAKSIPEHIEGWRSDNIFYCHNPLCLRSFSGAELHTSGEQRENQPSEASAPAACPLCRKELHSISLAEKNELPKDTVLLKRTYLSETDNVALLFSVVIGGRRRGSIHRAELCLPTQGFSMEKSELLSLNINGARITAQCLTAARPGSEPFSLVYWMESERRRTCSHTERIWLDIWDRSVNREANRWVMISISVSGGIHRPGRKELLENFLNRIYPQIIFKKEQK